MSDQQRVVWGATTVIIILLGVIGGLLEAKFGAERELEACHTVMFKDFTRPANPVVVSDGIRPMYREEPGVTALPHGWTCGQRPDVVPCDGGWGGGPQRLCRTGDMHWECRKDQSL